MIRSSVIKLMPITLLLCSSLALVGCGGSSSGPSGSAGTPGPGSDDEPIAELSAFNTATGFSVVREPGARLPVEVAVQYSDADFNAGLPAPVLQVPTGVDTSVNRAPTFTGLQNQTVVAGEFVEVIFAPTDADGGVPGMFEEALPQGATFVDNQDTTKTFRWQPLQADVGISSFTVVAIDPDNSEYRASQTILIKTVLPSDPDNIPNVEPTLASVDDYTVRVNDPVVLELKGLDLNGTIPTIEVPNAPAGSTINQHPRYEEVFVLKFVPTTVGDLTIDVVVRDSVDASLFTTTGITVSVQAASAFETAGQSLRALAEPRNLKIGFAASQSFYHRPGGALFADIAEREFNFVTPENSMKMDVINPEPGRFQFAATDNLVSFANAANMEVHGHPVLWHRQLPTWLTQSASSNVEQHMNQYIDRLMGRYKNDVTVWDVVNEPLEDTNGNMRQSIWYQAMGETYIDKAFARARAIAPSAQLLINEYDAFDAYGGAKATGLFALIDRLQARNVPLDGIGFQLHVFSSFNDFTELEANFASVAQRGLDIYITELDVSLSDGATTAQQATVYENIVSICLAQPRCKAIQTWGLTDRYSFRSQYDPLMFDRDYQPKPAYTAVQGVLADPAQ